MSQPRYLTVRSNGMKTSKLPASQANQKMSLISGYSAAELNSSRGVVYNRFVLEIVLFLGVLGIIINAASDILKFAKISRAVCLYYKTKKFRILC